MHLQIYEAIDWVRVSGRGYVATMESAYDDPPEPGSAIQIDGHIYRVAGVETVGRYYNGCKMGVLVGRRIKSVEYFDEP